MNKTIIGAIIGAIFLGGALDLKATVIGVDEGTPCSYNLNRKHAERLKAAAQKPFVEEAKVKTNDRETQRLKYLKELRLWAKVAANRIRVIQSSHDSIVRKETRHTCSAFRMGPHCEEITQLKPFMDIQSELSRLASSYELFLLADLRDVIEGLEEYESKYPQALESNDHHYAGPLVRSDDLRQSFAVLLQGYNNTNFRGVLKDNSLTDEDLLEFANGPVVSVTVTEPGTIRHATRANPKFGSYNVRQQLLENPSLETVQRALDTIAKLE